ncbi:hypothetical protein BJY04DRAFT_196913 [Aspergillus karnatakaensis]|uniref:uncharacterized protein n=1 Tax=Aspergillus karnatakaensis TaxID=1810916 RepID=UPI003CCDB6CA
MADLMDAIGSTFSSWRTRAARGVRWALYRKSRTESMMKSESPQSPQSHNRRDPSFAPQHPPLELGSSELDDTFHEINASDVHDSAHPTPLFISDTIEPGKATQNDPRLDYQYNGALQSYTTSVGSRGGTFGGDKEAELLNLYGGFREVSARRVRLRQTRMALKYKREEEVELRVKFMKHLNTFFADLNHPHAESIRREYELLQLTTEEYLTMENNYRREEDHLEEREYLLDVSMEGFAGTSERGTTPNVPPFTGPWSQISDEEFIAPELPRCVNSYLCRIGDERMLQERLSELESEWFMITERQDIKHRFYLPPDEDSEEFLLTFDEQRAEIWKDLNNAQMDVNFLRTYCIDQGYHGFNYEDISSLNFYQYSEQPSSELFMDPLKLPLEEKHPYSPEIDYLTGATDQSENDLRLAQISPNNRLQFWRLLQQNGSLDSIDFINMWMLHQVRVSSRAIWDIQHLSSWQPLREQGWQDYDISRHVLDGWFSDETGAASSPSDPYLDDGDTVTAQVYGAEEQLEASSMPSSPRTSAPKLEKRRHSRP